MKLVSSLSHKKILKLDKDHRESAKVARLVYVSDNKPGIVREKAGKSFRYTLTGKIIKDRSELERFKYLAIPPSWTNVWICPQSHGHIQATGFDMNNRKQYRYHKQWNMLRNETKFHRLYEFGKALPTLRRRVRKDMLGKDLNEKKVLATVVSLMEQTLIRVGNIGYEKLYGSYGLTTLKDRHVVVKKEEIIFSFTGKKGIDHSITIRNKKLARVVRQCRDIPGKELFQYYPAGGEKKSVDSGMVNNYIKETTRGDFTAKDFRTWAGTLHALDNFHMLKEASTDLDAKKNINSVLDAVSNKLGNSRSICRKYYVHPGIIQLYIENKLIPYIEAASPKEKTPEFSQMEKILILTLKKTM
ncbi:MAG: DNA topoisomerase IB [Chitinophagaceae bacterium]